MERNGQKNYTYTEQPAEVAWRKRLGITGERAARSGKCVTRIMTDSEAQHYGVSLKVVRSARAKKAAATRKARAISEERAAISETIERLAEEPGLVVA